MHFDCTIRTEGDTVVVIPFGDVDRDTAPHLRESLTSAVAQPGAVRVQVDLRHITFLDSSGIGALLAGHRQATAAGLAFQAKDPSASVRMVLELTNVWTLLGT